MDDLTATSLREYAAANVERLGPNVLRRLLGGAAVRIDALSADVARLEAEANDRSEWNRRITNDLGSATVRAERAERERDAALARITELEAQDAANVKAIASLIVRCSIAEPERDAALADVAKLREAIDAGERAFNRLNEPDELWMVDDSYEHRATGAAIVRNAIRRALADTEETNDA